MDYSRDTIRKGLDRHDMNHVVDRSVLFGFWQPHAVLIRLAKARSIAAKTMG